MGFESVKSAAQRLGVTTRAVQKWAAKGKISGAKKTGRDWLIPAGCPDPRKGSAYIKTETSSAEGFAFRQSLPLLSGKFSAGKSLEYINSLEDEDDRNIALGEYYYYTGNPEKAAELIEPYLISDSPALKYSAELYSVFINIALGRTHLAKYSLNRLYKQMQEGFENPDHPIKEHAVGVMTAHALNVLLHVETEIKSKPPLEDFMKYLSGGFKLWACYVLAYRAYQNKKYEVALGISDLALALVPEEYPVPTIYCRLVGVMSLVGLMRINEAKERFSDLWVMIEADGFYEIVGEHYTELMGMVDALFKKSEPEIYDKLFKIIRTFGVNWIKLHNSMSDHEVADNLTATEFTVAMLYNRGWSAQEISSHLDISEYTVRSYIKTIYIKLGINDKKSLAQYMLK